MQTLKGIYNSLFIRYGYIRTVRLPTPDQQTALLCPPRQELAVQLPHPRDRRDPLLARLKAQALTELQQAHVI
jgi:hypothetical protein